MPKTKKEEKHLPRFYKVNPSVLIIFLGVVSVLFASAYFLFSETVTKFFTLYGLLWALGALLLYLFFIRDQVIISERFLVFRSSIRTRLIPWSDITNFEQKQMPDSIFPLVKGNYIWVTFKNKSSLGHVVHNISHFVDKEELLADIKDFLKK